VALLDELNAGAPRTLFARSIGRSLSAAQIRASFDAAYGAGAGLRVTVVCSGGLITELRLGLAGDIGATPSLGVLLRAARPRPQGCSGGRVDRAG
jgi:ribonuclease T2